MPITYTTDFKGQASGVGAAITSNALTVVAGAFITICMVYADNAETSAATVSNTGTTITWTKQAETNVASNCKVVLWSGTAGATPPTTVTTTSTAGTALNGSKAMAVQIHVGQHATNPLPPGNIFSGAGATSVSQNITPTSAGSALWGAFGDWSATNTYAAGANNTLVGTYQDPTFQTVALVRATTQPRTDAVLFALGETDTAGKITFIAFEVQSAAPAAQLLAPAQKLFKSFISRLQPPFFLAGSPYQSSE